MATFRHLGLNTVLFNQVWVRQQTRQKPGLDREDPQRPLHSPTEETLKSHCPKVVTLKRHGGHIFN